MTEKRKVWTVGWELAAFFHIIYSPPPTAAWGDSGLARGPSRAFSPLPWLAFGRIGLYLFSKPAQSGAGLVQPCLSGNPSRALCKPRLPSGAPFSWRLLGEGAHIPTMAPVSTNLTQSRSLPFARPNTAHFFLSRVLLGPAFSAVFWAWPPAPWAFSLSWRRALPGLPHAGSLRFLFQLQK